MSKDYGDRQFVAKVVTGFRCDGCGRYEAAGKPNVYSANVPDPEGWYEFSSHHSEWGNDSEESYERHDVCSAAVLRHGAPQADDGTLAGLPEP